jgi:hypothetical protein
VISGANGLDLAHCALRLVIVPPCGARVFGRLLLAVAQDDQGLGPHGVHQLAPVVGLAQVLPVQSMPFPHA